MRSFFYSIALILVLAITLSCGKDSSEAKEAEEVITSILSRKGILNSGNRVEDVKLIYNTKQFYLYSCQVVNNQNGSRAGAFEYIKWVNMSGDPESDMNGSVWDMVIDVDKALPFLSRYSLMTDKKLSDDWFEVLMVDIIYGALHDEELKNRLNKKYGENPDDSIVWFFPRLKME